MNITSSRAEVILHDEFIRRLKNPAAAAPRASESEPVDRAALETELPDLKPQHEYMAWVRSQAPDRGSFIGEASDGHQTATNRLAPRIVGRRRQTGRQSLARSPQGVILGYAGPRLVSHRNKRRHHGGLASSYMRANRLR